MKFLQKLRLLVIDYCFLRKIRKKILKTVKSYTGEKISLFDYGNVSPDLTSRKHVFCIIVSTDDEKHFLKKNKNLNNMLNHLLCETNAENSGKHKIDFLFESQETIDRESNGNWFEHFK